jgi:hypothetical protein
MIEDDARSAASQQLPVVKLSAEILTKEEKLDKLLDLINDIDYEGDYAILKFNTPVIIASPGDVALVAGKSLIMKTIDGVIHLN